MSVFNHFSAPPLRARVCHKLVGVRARTRTADLVMHKLETMFGFVLLQPCATILPNKINTSPQC